MERRIVSIELLPYLDSRSHQIAGMMTNSGVAFFSLRQFPKAERFFCLVRSLNPEHESGRKNHVLAREALGGFGELPDCPDSLNFLLFLEQIYGSEMNR